MRKKLSCMLFALALSAAVPGTALAGWESDSNGWWYQYENGSYAKSGIKEVEGQKYCFDSNGYMLTGWQYVGWRWYYFDNSGPQAMGWTQLDGKWYYLDPKEDGAMRTYWLELPDPNKKSRTNRYYLDESGVLQTGMFFLSDETNGSRYAYQADENGVLIRNKTVKSGDTELRYDEFGVIYFRNPQTKREARLNDEDEWQPLLSDSELESMKDD